jgi:hypothetical protein
MGKPLIGKPLIGKPLIGNPLIGNPLIGKPLIGNPMLGRRMHTPRRQFLQQSLATATLLATRTTFCAPLTLSTLKSPVLFPGDATHAYRDPAAIFHNGWFYLYFTHVVTGPDKIAYSHLAWSKSRYLTHWTAPINLTPSDKSLDYGSPGDIIRHNDQWVICLQTYPRPHGERYGNQDARIFTMRSDDLEHWSTPELLRIKGPEVPVEKMGRMIDPYLLADKDIPNKWWCFYKQNGISLSNSPDLQTWTSQGHIDAGENPCVLVDQNQYLLFHSPSNGIGIKRSPDLKTWYDEGTLTLGQKQWPWAQGRLTAAFVLDLRADPTIGKALMFFHASTYPETDPRGGFDNYASLAIAWSTDLRTWDWPH